MHIYSKMNVILFFIEAGSNSDKSAISLIKKDIVSYSNNDREIINKSKTEWKKLGTSLKSLYNAEDIIGFQEIQGIKHFIFNVSSSRISTKKRVTLEILILSEIEDINHSLNVVYKNLKDIFTSFKITVLKKNHVFLFPYNLNKKDIYDCEQKIKVEYTKTNISRIEWLRIILIGIISSILLSLYRYGDIADETKTIFISIGGACVVFLMTEVALKLSPYLPFLNDKLNVSVNDLSNCIKHNLIVPYSEGEEQNLKNPDEGSQ